MSRYLAPNWISRSLVNPLAMRLGVATTLSVRTRSTSRTQHVPVNVLSHDGHEYLVAVRGETQWVRNLRAAGECELRRAGRTRRYTAAELSGERRDAIVRAYRARWGLQVAQFFKALPDPADHPTFLLRPASNDSL